MKFFFQPIAKLSIAICKKRLRFDQWWAKGEDGPDLKRVDFNVEPANSVFCKVWSGHYKDFALREASAAVIKYH